MARADLLLNLAKAGRIGDQELLQRTLEALIADERGKHHHIVADRLKQVLESSNGHVAPRMTRAGVESPPAGFIELTPERTLSDLILPQNVRTTCHELIEEHLRSDLLRSYGLEPRNRILLAGPPGNGKTTVAEGVAEALMLPMLVARYETLVGSYLGETAQRLDRLFAAARTRQVVLFFDEFDTLGKERGDTHDTGEIKRVVSSLLLQIDRLPSHVVVIAATNHPELLDRAVWRRFQIRLELPAPNTQDVLEWFRRFEERSHIRIPQAKSTLAKNLRGLSFAEVADFGMDIARRAILSQPDSDVGAIVKAELDQLRHRFKPDTPTSA